ISVDATAPADLHMHGPSREQVAGDPYQNDPRIAPAFNSYSPSGDVEGELVYANYGRAEDFELLQKQGIELRGKIVLARYGQVFRGVKTYLAEQLGASAVLIYSDPSDDGAAHGEVYPKGPWRPLTAVQRGSIQYGWEYPGDPTTPGFASIESAALKRVPPEKAANLPKVPTVPLSAADAAPLLRALS